MNSILFATGVLPMVLLGGAVLAVPLSVWLLWLYRRAVVRGMARRSGAVAAAAAGPPANTALPAARLRFALAGAEQICRPATADGAWAFHSLRRLGAVYLLGGLAYAAVLSGYWLLTQGFAWTRWLMLLLLYAWPAVIVLCLVAAIGARQRFAILGAYGAVLAAVSGYALLRNPNLDALQIIVLWLVVNGAETALLLAFLTRPIRAVGPLVFSFTVLGVAGALGLIELGRAAGEDAFIRGMAKLAEVLGISGPAVFWGLHGLGFVAGGGFAFAALRWAGRRYAAKRMSDQGMTADAVFLLFAVAQPLSFAFESIAWVPLGLAGFAAYQLATRLGYTVLIPAAERPRRLLLLRVFALGRRGARLFDAFSKAWRRLGGISLIAGPDLATSTLEPQEFLEFVGGRLSRQFVSDGADLERRLTKLDLRPDPDGRFRVNEFFCRDDTWLTTMRRLAAGSDAVLMDLRGFSADRQGCRIELGELLANIPLDRFLLVVDDSTDLPLLETVLQGFWEALPLSSPNHPLPEPEVRLFALQAESAREVRALLTLLTG